MKLKTALYLSHRWLGIGGCLLLAMWFASGMVMMYVAYPELTEQERYAGLRSLDPEQVMFSPSALIARHPAETPIEHLKLTSIAQRPVYLIKRQGMAWLGMYADSGDLFGDATLFGAGAPELAVASAADFFQARYPKQTVEAASVRTLDMDQWTVSSELSDYRPLHLVSLNDPAGTRLYVSARTGQVVRDTTRRERIWNWLGANLHWIYPLQLRRHTDFWVNTVIVLSLLGLITIVTGAIIGFLRLRIRRPYRGGGYSPYRGIPKYHHVLGLLSLIFLTTFMFSGLMSMRPWGVFDGRTSFTDQIRRYRWGDRPVESELACSQVGEIQQLLKQPGAGATKELVWHWIGGESHVSLHSSAESAATRLAVGKTQTLARRIGAGLGRLMPEEPAHTQQRLDDYDAYYYSHHDRWRTLPIQRVKFSDPESTWFHIDLATGEVLERLTYRNRVERWLFNGLHSLDFAVLIKNRPIWDLLLIALCSAGLLFSLTSIVMAWRRLGKRVKGMPERF